MWISAKSILNDKKKPHLYDEAFAEAESDKDIMRIPCQHAVKRRTEPGMGDYAWPFTSFRPLNGARAPSASSIRISWLYLATRSERLIEPVLI